MPLSWIRCKCCTVAVSKWWYSIGNLKSYFSDISMGSEACHAGNKFLVGQIYDVKNEMKEAGWRHYFHSVRLNSQIVYWPVPRRAWECIWSELVVERKGINSFLDRIGLDYESYTFSFKLRNEMWNEVNRLTEKYQDQDTHQAIDLVDILTGHRARRARCRDSCWFT